MQDNKNKTVLREWKWSIGEPYQRSARFRKTQEDFDREKMEFNKEMEKYDQQNKQNAFEQSFLTENDVWGIGVQDSGRSFGFETFSQQTSNKREESSNKMAEREMMGQIGFNPFMQNNSYIDDVTVQENFLRPKSTYSEKEK
jgi:hypothetical protein